jgi:hypothetical protein
MGFHPQEASGSPKAKIRPLLSIDVIEKEELARFQSGV